MSTEDNLPITTVIDKRIKVEKFTKLMLKAALILGGSYLLNEHHNFIVNLDAYAHGGMLTILKNSFLVGIASTVLIDNMLYTKDKLKTKLSKIANSYIQFNHVHSLTQFDKWVLEPSNTESVIKHTLLGLYFSKYGLMDNQVVNQMDKSYLDIQNKVFLIPKILELAQHSPSYQQSFQKIYAQEFAGESIMGYALFQAPLSVLKPLIYGLGDKLGIGETDCDYLKRPNDFLSPESKLTKEKVEFLFQEKYYIQLPKKIRQYLIDHVDSALLEQYKDRLVSYENELDEKVGQDIDNLKNQYLQELNTQVEQVKTTPTHPEKQEPTLKLEQVIEQLSSHHLINDDIINQLSKLVEQAHFVSQNIDKLDVEKSVEFKHFIDIALPKYLQVFSHSDNETHQNDFLNTLTLFENYLHSCVDDIKKTKDNEFLVADTYFKNKLSSYSQTETKEDKKLHLKA